MPWAAIVGAVISAYGQNAAAKKNKQGTKGLIKEGRSNPYGSILPFGSAGFDPTNRESSFQEDALSNMMRQALGGSALGQLGGGLFNDPQFQQAFQHNDINSALIDANQRNSVMMGPSAFGGMGGLFNNASALSGMLGQNVAAGPQDLTGGMQGGLLGAGFGNTLQAGDQSGLIQQNLDASRGLAQPFEDRLLNRVQDQLFAQGRLGTTGGAQQFGEVVSGIQRGDLQRILNAQGLGLQAANQQGQLGLGQMGLGSQLFGQNLGAYNNQLQGFQGLSQLAGGLEGQQFGQYLQSLQQNQSAGQQRLSNALGLFGLGNEVFGNNFQRGLGAQQGLLGQNNQSLSAILGLLNADANRIGGASGFANAIGQGTANQAAGIGGLGNALGGIFSMFGGTGGGGGSAGIGPVTGSFGA